MAKFCQKCGTGLNSDDTFCSNCGAPISDEAKTVASNNNSSSNYNGNTQPKSKIAAGVLAVIPLTGSLGIYNFYLGYTSKAVAQLLITILSCGALSVVTWIWSLIEGIMIFTGSINKDAFGNDLVG